MDSLASHTSPKWWVTPLLLACVYVVGKAHEPRHCGKAVWGQFGNAQLRAQAQTSLPAPVSLLSSCNIITLL